MSIRKQIGEYKFRKNCSHTVQSTMSHRPLTNSSSLKITAAYGAARSFVSAGAARSFVSAGAAKSVVSACAARSFWALEQL
jgi:hypothetical protein